MKGREELLLARLEQKLDKSGDCWLWKGAISGPGYGMISVHNSSQYVHRLMYEIAIAPIPAGKVVDHLCRVRSCGNPAHLEVVSNRENVLRGSGISAINARKTHCKRGHEFTPANIYWSSDGRRRKCKPCALARSKQGRDTRYLNTQ